MILPLNLPWEPDKGVLSQTSLDYVMNVLPLPEGWGPIPALTLYSDSLGAPCKGAWWFRNDTGVFNVVAATQTRLYKLSSSAAWTDISHQSLGPDTILNGTFATDTIWGKGTGWSISGGNGVASGVVGAFYLTQSQTLTVGTTYRLTYTIVTRTAGGVRPFFSGGTAVYGTARTAAGTYTDTLTAVTGNNILAFEPTAYPTTLTIDNVSLQTLTTTYVGPGDGELWTAALFGQDFYVSNINDPLQVIDTLTMTTFGDAPGSPPQAKYVATVGDFLFLGHLKVAATVHPRSWQHSKINDPTNWVVDGAPGASDGQDIPDGDDIVAILPTISSGARIIQKRAKRGLVFSPGSATAFSQIDIDAARGAVAPHSVVPLGSTSYFYLTENGFCLDDDYKSIGAEKIDTWFLANASPNWLFAVKATADQTRKIIWVTYKDQVDTDRVIGYNWFLDRWFQSDEDVDVFISTVSPGYVLDDLTGVLDDYPTPPLDSPYWAGGRISFGGFKADGIMYLFSGDKAAAIIETPTMQLSEGRGAYVWGAELIGNLTGFTLQHATAFTPDQTLTWSPERTRSNITNICPFAKDGKWHRFRLNIGSGGSGTHVHGIRSHEKPSTLA